jgi:hypothetical protein
MKSGLRMERGALARAELELLDVERGAFVFSLWKNVIVTVWGAAATAERVARFGAVVSKHGERLPGLRSHVQIIVESAGLPTDEARSAFSGLMNARHKQVACLALVVQGTGFWSGAMRSAITQMRMQASVPVAHRTFSTIEEVTRWLPGEHEKRSGVAVTGDDLRTVLEGALREI